MHIQRISEKGEKRLIAEIIRPLFNPTGNPNSVGDDCAIVELVEGRGVCISTDRVPGDLISFKLGLIDIRQLGYYLAVLNISDLAAAGAVPRGLLLNLGLPRDLSLADFESLLRGAHEASMEYNCPVIGGDLSDSAEINLVATSVGELAGPQRLYRSGAKPNDAVFCCDVLGITATAFAYYLDGKRGRPAVSAEEERILCSNFRSPRARIELGKALRESGACSAVMDNTDGVGQSLLELAAASGVAMHLDEALLPVSNISRRVAAHQKRDLADLVLGPGADFQLIGTVRPEEPSFDSIRPFLQIIGTVAEGDGVWLKRPGKPIERFSVSGWNYYLKNATQ